MIPIVSSKFGAKPNAYWFKGTLSVGLRFNLHTRPADLGRHFFYVSEREEFTDLVLSLLITPQPHPGTVQEFLVVWVYPWGLVIGLAAVPPAVGPPGKRLIQFAYSYRMSPT